MRTRRLLPTVLAAAVTVGALAFTPAGLMETTSDDGGATADPAPGEGELLGACDDRAAGTTVLTPGAFFDNVVPTPVGAAGSTQADAAVFQVSLEGQPVGTTAELALTLDWDTPELGDYDLITNGDNLLDTAKPERKTLTVLHCSVIDVDTEVFTGTPLDTLTLTADVTAIAPAG